MRGWLVYNSFCRQGMRYTDAGRLKGQKSLNKRRVLIEFFDKEPIKNVLGSCIFEPELVVFLCDKRDLKQVKESAVYRLFRRRKLKTKVRFYYMEASDPQEIVRVMDAVARDYPGCVFDFSGGRDLALLMAGSYLATKPIQGYYIDYTQGKFVDLRGCQALEKKFSMPVFSAEDIFALTGATVHGYGHFQPSDLTPEFEEDALHVWEIVQENTRAWGGFVAWIQACCARQPSTATLVPCPLHFLAEPHGVKYNPAILDRLLEKGILTRYTLDKREAVIEFKSLLMKKCLMNQGIWLELYCYVVSRRAGFFDDVRTSLVIDWDGMEGKPDTTKNEVDVFLVRGVRPVFVSCKMSTPVPLALAEIKLLSLKFGGPGSRTVLLTAGTLGPEHKALQNRAQDLGIELLDMAVMNKGRLVHELIRIALERE